MIPQNIVWNLSTATEQTLSNMQGYSVDFGSLAIAPNSSLQPLAKTISNCVAPTLFGALTASNASGTLSSIDLSSISSATTTINDSLSPVKDLYNMFAG